MDAAADPALQWLDPLLGTFPSSDPQRRFDSGITQRGDETGRGDPRTRQDRCVRKVDDLQGFGTRRWRLLSRQALQASVNAV